LVNWVEQVAREPSVVQRIFNNVFQSGEKAGPRVLDMVVSRRGAGFGQEFDVYIITTDEVHKWHITAGADGVAVEHLKVRGRLVEGGGKLVGIQMQRACGSEGRWADARLVLLAASPDTCTLTVFFLSLADLSTLRTESLPATPGLWGGEADTDDLRLLPLTAPAPRPGPTVGNPSEVPSVHVTDGRRLFSIRCDGRLLNVANRTREWSVGPAARPCGWHPLEEEGRRQAELLLLLPEGVCILQPAEEEEEDELRARGAWDDGGLLQLLRGTDQGVEGLGRLPALRERIAGVQEGWRASPAATARQEDRAEQACVALVAAIQALTLDRPMEAGGGGGGGGGGGAGQGEALDRQACGLFLRESERRLQEYAQAARALEGRKRPDLRALLDGGLRALQDRARAARALLEEERAAGGGPRLAPGSLLSEAIEGAVARWEGANRLRPWSAAWRAFCGRVSAVEDVLWAACECLRRRIEERARGADLELEQVRSRRPPPGAAPRPRPRQDRGRGVLV
jgi:hypothetical protein